MKKFLSAVELKNCRTLPRNLPERGGAKCAISHDELKEYNELQFLLDDRKSALKEQKVEKLSSLIKGEWLPEKRAVRILKNVGRHLQHMGFIMDSDRALYPEEALYLMDVKSMEVYYKNLPLSMQEAHSLFLGSVVDLLRYQVYSHLSRLGYIAIRYQSRYERKIGLDKYFNCEKRNPPKEPVATCISNEIESIQLDTSDEDDELMECTMVTETSIVNGWNSVLTKLRCDRVGVPECITAAPAIPCLLARHKEIAVPNAYGKTLFALLASSPCFLPPGVMFRKEMYIIDLTKLYSQSNMPPKEFHCHRLRQPEVATESLSHRFVERLSWHKEQEASKRRKYPSQPSSRQKWKGGRRWKGTFNQSESRQDTNQYPNVPEMGQHLIEAVSDNGEANHFLPTIEMEAAEFENVEYKRKVNHLLPPRSHIKTRAQSWKQYKAELTTATEIEKFNSSEYNHLSTSKCKPLVALKDATSTVSILQKLQIIHQARLTETFSLSDHLHCCNLPDLLYEVYLPGTEFARNRLMLPNHRLIVASISDPLPSLELLGRIAKYLDDGIPIHFAVVDNGDIAFYYFNDISAPVDVTMG